MGSTTPDLVTPAHPHAALADALYDALGRYDVEALRPLLAPDAVRWLNLTGDEQDVPTLLAVVDLERSHVAEARFELRGRMLADDGFTLQMTVHGTTTGGTTYSIPVCLVVTVTDGKVTRLDEYANLPDVLPLLQELGLRQ